MSTDVPETERPRRADAQRNRDRVLEAARVAFAEHGPDVAVSEITRLAGVGSGTLFRHFATKHDLLIAVLDQTFDQLTGTVDHALAMDDPWDGLVHVLTSMAELQANNRLVLQSVGPELFGEERFLRRNEAMMDSLARILSRARAAGVVRDDLAAEDLPFVLAAIGGATQQCAGTVAATGASGCVSFDPDGWRRYLGIVLDGLRPEGAHPLDGTAPTRAQLVAAKTAKAATPEA